MAYATSSGNYFNYTRNYNVSALTVGVWINLTSTISSEVTPCGLWEDSTGDFQWLLTISTDPRLVAAVDNGAVRVASASGTLSTNVWTHIALVYSASNLLLYQNGSQVGSATGGGNLTSRTSATGIGARQLGNRAFPGNIAEFATWTSALSSAEIASLADGFKPSRIKKPEIYIPFIREKLNIAGNYAITTNGTPTVQSHPRIY